MSKAHSSAPASCSASCRLRPCTLFLSCLAFARVVGNLRCRVTFIMSCLIVRILPMRVLIMGSRLVPQCGSASTLILLVCISSCLTCWTCSHILWTLSERMPCMCSVLFCVCLCGMLSHDVYRRLSLTFGFPGQGQICLEAPSCNYYYYFILHNCQWIHSLIHISCQWICWLLLDTAD